MATAEVLKVTHGIDDKMKGLIEGTPVNHRLVLHAFLIFQMTRW